MFFFLRSLVYVTLCGTANFYSLICCSLSLLKNPFGGLVYWAVLTIRDKNMQKMLLYTVDIQSRHAGHAICTAVVLCCNALALPLSSTDSRNEIHGEKERMRDTQRPKYELYPSKCDKKCNEYMGASIAFTSTLTNAHCTQRSRIWLDNQIQQKVNVARTYISLFFLCH